jgi:hypothetical protein
MLEASVILVLVCVVGALIGGLRGVLQGEEPLDTRKILLLIIEAVIAGIVASLTFVGITPIFPWTYLLAFLAGLGIDVTGYLGANAVKAMLA